MLDENLPTFFFRPSSDNPLKSFLYFTHHGCEPTPEYLFQKVDPALPQSKNKYASALGDPVAQDVIFGEVLIEPEFQQPTLSAAEIRAQNGVTPPPVPLIPDGFTIQLYNPDQQVTVRGEKSAWTGKESWEFEMPQQSFRKPSASKLDRQRSDEVITSLSPKTVFKWKRDGKFSKDMTCYMTGTSVNGKKSKDPDITVAMFKHGREHAITIYEPNLQRVEVEDRKGLEVVFLLGAEVIREIYLSPSRDSFNISGVAPSRRKNSRPLPGTSSSPTPASHVMSGAMGNVPPAKITPPVTQQPTPPLGPSDHAAIDVETRRLQAMVEQEEREREKRDRAEQRRIKMMLEEEERERQRREAEVAKETERLRREYGVEGQDFGPPPSLPPRPTAGPSSRQDAGRPPARSPRPHAGQSSFETPPRPSSAEPRTHGGALSRLLHLASPQPQSQLQKNGRRRGDSSEGPNMSKKKSTLF
ncbi:hypothetical protein DL770_007034 [Monosporascus sp. CRB-9-2]|nr:hypothetical protein DL770_007034 [Monosporascus sp. CRB-9-2]